MRNNQKEKHVLYAIEHLLKLPEFWCSLIISITVPKV